MADEDNPTAEGAAATVRKRVGYPLDPEASEGGGRNDAAPAPSPAATTGPGDETSSGDGGGAQPATPAAAAAAAPQKHAPKRPRQGQQPPATAAKSAQSAPRARQQQQQQQGGGAAPGAGAGGGGRPAGVSRRAKWRQRKNLQRQWAGLDQCAQEELPAASWGDLLEQSRIREQEQEQEQEQQEQQQEEPEEEQREAEEQEMQKEGEMEQQEENVLKTDIWSTQRAPQSNVASEGHSKSQDIHTGVGSGLPLKPVQEKRTPWVPKKMACPPPVVKAEPSEHEGKEEIKKAVPIDPAFDKRTPWVPKSMPSAAAVTQQYHSHEPFSRRYQYPKKTEGFCGNYSTYYGYRYSAEERNSNAPDVRLGYIPSQWFQDKVCLDVGCNAGTVTIDIAQHFDPKEITGLDIDPNLVYKANCAKESKLSSTLVSASAAVSTPQSNSSSTTTSASSNTVSKSKFPANVKFQVGDILELDDTVPKYDVIVCFSLTKWVHLMHGDRGLITMFRKFYNLLLDGGVLVLEPQLWKSYNKRGKFTEAMKKNYREAKIRPPEFTSVLLQEIGFTSFKDLYQPPEGKKAGFDRPITAYWKNATPAQATQTAPQVPSSSSTTPIATPDPNLPNSSLQPQPTIPPHTQSTTAEPQPTNTNPQPPSQPTSTATVTNTGTAAPTTTDPQSQQPNPPTPTITIPTTPTTPEPIVEQPALTNHNNPPSTTNE